MVAACGMFYWLTCRNCWILVRVYFSVLNDVLAEWLVVLTEWQRRRYLCSVSCILSAVYRFTGSLVPRFTGSPVHPFTRSPVHPFTRSPVHPFTRSPVHRCTGAPVHWCIGASVHRCIGASVHRCIGAFIEQLSYSYALYWWIENP